MGRLPSVLASAAVAALAPAAVLLVAAAGCATRPPVPARSPGAPATGVAWTVGLAAPGADPRVTLTAPCLGGRAPTLRVGSRLGRLDHLDAFVAGIAATADGTPVNVHRKEGKVTVDGGRCRVLRVRYHLALPSGPFPVAKGGAQPPARAGELPFSGPKGLFLLGRLTLLAPDVAPVGPVRLGFRLPTGWHADAPLARGPGGAFVAPDVGAVLHAFYAAAPGKARVAHGGGSTARVRLLVPGEPKADARFTGRLRRLVAAAADLFDAGDAWHGLVIVKDDLGPGGYAAAVAGQSVVLDLPAKRPGGLEAAALRVAALELAHTWRCAARPAPSPAELQWDFQGVARYLAWRSLARAGLAPEGGLDGELQDALDAARRAAAGAGEPSLVAAGARFAKSGAARALAGAGGALLAYHLDARLRAGGGGRRLVGLLRRLRNRWCPAHPTVSLADVLAQTRDYGGAVVAADLKALLHAPGFPDPATVFQGTGCHAAEAGGRWRLTCRRPIPALSKETHHDRPKDAP